MNIQFKIVMAVGLPAMLSLMASLAFAQAIASTADRQFAKQLFHFQLGLWHQIVTIDGRPAPTSIEMCVDETVAANASVIASRTAAPGYPGCRIEWVKQQPGSTNFAVDCMKPGQGMSRIVSNVSQTPEGDYILVANASVSAGGQTAKSQIVSRFHSSGVCPADQQAGDLTAIMTRQRVKLPNLQSLDQLTSK